MECTVHRSERIFNATTIFGRIEHVHVDNDICTDGRVDMTKVGAVGRLGGPYYTGIEPLPFKRGQRDE